MKYLTCLLTFFSYSSLHALRMCYSFNKLYVKKQFLITDFYLGILDALVYLSLGAGTLMRYTIIKNAVNLTKIYLIASILTSISIAIIATLGLIQDYERSIHQHNQYILRIIITIALITFGFTQLTSRPIAAALLASELKQQQHGCLVGTWATHASAGHITGLLFSNFLVHTFKLKWQCSIFIAAIFSISTALFVYFILQNPIEKLFKQYKHVKEKQKPQTQQKIQQQLHQHSSHQFFSFIKDMLKSSEYRYYIVAFTIIKAMVYTVLLWFPLYLDSVNLKRYSGYITILFQIGAIVGSFIFGRLYDYEGRKHAKSQQILKKIHKNSIMVRKIAVSKSFVAMMSLTIIIGIFYFMRKQMLGYCVFSFAVGFFLGGISNTLGTKDVVLFSKDDGIKIDYLSNFSMGLSYCFVGFCQLIMGFALYKQNEQTGNEGFTERKIIKSHHSYKFLFIVLLGLGIIVSILFALKLFIKRQQNLDRMSYDVLQDQLQI